jgi:hypothetical protein
MDGSIDDVKNVSVLSQSTAAGSVGRSARAEEIGRRLSRNPMCRANFTSDSYLDIAVRLERPGRE